MQDLLSKESLYVGALAAGVTLILIVMVGILGGVSLGLILLRGILFSLLLFVLGTGLGILLQKFVPDIWSDPGEGSGGGEKHDDEEESSYVPPVGLDVTIGSDPEPSPSGGGYSMEMPSAPMGEVDEELQPASSKKKDAVVGNYRIVDDKKFPNDPEQYAKAVRTMLKRDD